jgi:L-amino acid N-acyltransferase
VTGAELLAVKDAPIRQHRGVIVRDASPADLAAMRDIYNALIPTTTVAWTEEQQSLDQRRVWFEQQQEAGWPVLAADDDGEVVGFCSYGSFRGRGKWHGYRHTVEHTIHVRESHWGAGVGRVLLDALIARARAAGIHVMVGAIDSDNTGSIAFHRRLGFEEVGRMPEIGRKFDRWLDLVLMQRILDQPS